MGAVASIDKCSKDVCCPDELKLLEDNQKISSGINKENENSINSNGKL